MDKQPEGPTEIVGCGCCGHYHRAAYRGDCRNDEERFTIDQVEDFFGNEGTGWILTEDHSG
jgi:hypothetical protein